MAFSQFSTLWKGYFSYNQISDITEANFRFYASAENAIFSKSLQTNDIKTINTIDGLSGLTISKIYHSNTVNRTFVGYENGLMLVINNNDNSILKVVSIRDQEGGIPPNQKKINDFFEFNNILYIATDFGIVEYKLSTFLFRDTFMLGAFGAQINIKHITVFDGYLYAMSPNNGIRRGNLSNPNLINFNAWEQFDSGYWTGVSVFQNQLVAINADGNVYRYNGTFFTPILSLGAQGLDIRSIGNNLIVTTATKVYILNQTFGQMAQISNTQILETTPIFTCATIIDNTIVIGTSENGVYQTSLASPTTFENILPDGPSRNRIFSIQTVPSGNFWATYGDYNQFNNPYPLDSYGLSKYTTAGWLNIPYENLLGTKTIVRITVNPSNENQVFASSYYSGLLKLEDDVAVTLFNQTNSTLQSLVDPGNPSSVDIRIEQSAYDKNGNLWMSNGLINNMMKVLRSNGQWQSYSVENVLSSLTSNGKLTIDKNNTKWLATVSQGVIGFNENYSNKLIKITQGDALGNLPSEIAQVATVDNRNQLWIGTRKGLRVLPSVDRFINETELTTNPIIILDTDGVAQELLFEQFITDIFVDGANNKWIGTLDAGVFYFSSNGQQTIYHFTTANSPLPSNNVADIDINSKTGEVFFVTSKGTVSFKGTSTKSEEDLSNVYVFPNPVRPDFYGTVKISGLVDKANVKITDIEGNLVHEKIVEGGTIEWDTTAFGKYRVASGVYMIFISTDDGLETKVKKVMIIR